MSGLPSSLPFGDEVERDVALELERADKKSAGGDEDGAAAIGVTLIDGGLDGVGVERGAVALGAELFDVVDGAGGAGVAEASDPADRFVDNAASAAAATAGTPTIPTHCRRETDRVCHDHTVRT